MSLLDRAIPFLLVLAVAGEGRRRPKAPTTAPGKAPGKAPAGRDKILAALDDAGVDDDTWRAWALWVAMGESGWNSSAWNGKLPTPGGLKERAAAGKAYDRLVADGRWPCEHTRAKYAIGSGGWYGQLAPFTVMFLPEHPLQCEPRAAWVDPVASTLAHFGQLAGTARILRRKDSSPNMLQLRALYGVPSRDPATVDTPQRRAGYTKTLERAGIDPSLLDAPVPTRVPQMIEVAA